MMPSRLSVTLIAVALLIAVCTAQLSLGPYSLSLLAEKIACGPTQSDENCISFTETNLHLMFSKFMRRLGHALTSAATFDALASHMQHGSRRSPSFDVVNALSQYLRSSPTVDHSLVEIRDMLKAAKAEAGSSPSSSSSSGSSSNSTEYPYFAFFPQPVGNIVPNGWEVMNFATNCFGSVVVTGTQINTTHVELVAVTSNQLVSGCADTFFVFALDAVSIQEYSEVGSYSIVLNVASGVAATAAGQWYLNTKGIQWFKFHSSLLDTIAQVVETAILFEGLESPIPAAAFDANLAFLQTYIEASTRLQPKSTTRASGSAVGRGLDPNYINDGDALFLMRLDGLNPMIGWGEGDTVGHAVIALRNAAGVLQVCESTVHDSYWPKNGIQCHEWTTWLNMTEKAQFNMILAPLAPEYSKKFKTSDALDFFVASEGLAYGYQSFLFGWIDTLASNYPCLPDSYTNCFSSNIAEVLALVLDGVLGNSPSNFFRQALQHRAGLWPAPESNVIDVLMASNVSFAELITVPEQDSWLYNTTRYGEPAIGKSMVCCVFVCNMWKAAGVFGDLKDSIQCGEQTLWDIFSMQIYDTDKMGAKRPQACQTYDPTNPLCQLMGDVTLELKPDFNTRNLYANMGETCASMPPEYIRQPGC